MLAPSVAQAKGVVDVTVRIEEDGRGRTLQLDRDAHAVDLALATRFYSTIDGAAFGTGEIAPPTDERLGPRYVAVFRAHQGPDEVVRIRQDLYPFADLGPLVFTPPDQGWDDGWRRVGWGLVDLFEELGVTAPDHGRWRTVYTDARDFALTVPASWHPAPVMGAALGIDPILVVGSSPTIANARGDRCAGLSRRALASVGPTDALVAVLRYRHPARWAADSVLPYLFGTDVPWQPWPAECSPPPTITVRMLRVPLHDARLQLVVAVGRDATPATNGDVSRVLDSLRGGPG
jgi:hypothetical protein